MEQDAYTSCTESGPLRRLPRGLFLFMAVIAMCLPQCKEATDPPSPQVPEDIPESTESPGPTPLAPNPTHAFQETGQWEMDPDRLHAIHQELGLNSAESRAVNTAMASLAFQFDGERFTMSGGGREEICGYRKLSETGPIMTLELAMNNGEKERIRLAFLDPDKMTLSREGAGRLIPLRRVVPQSSSQSQK